MERIEGKIPKLYYGYVIVGLSFLALFAVMGIRGSFGTYVTPWEDSFSVSRSWVSFVSFFSLFVYGISLAIAGRLSDSLGTRKVLSISLLLLGTSLIGIHFVRSFWGIFIIYGLIMSIGFGFASNVTVSVAIVKWFKEKKGLMISFVVIGMAAGPMVYAPLNIYMIDHVGWRAMFLIYGLIYLLILLPTYIIFFKDQPGFKENVVKYSNDAPKMKKRQKSTPNSNVFSIFKHKVTWFIIIVYFICGFTDIGLIHTHLVPLGESRHFTREFLAVAVIVYGIVNIAGTIGVGYLLDFFSPKKLLVFLFGLRILSLLLLIFTNQSAWLLVFACLYGLTDVATIAPFTMLCSKIYGIDQMGSSFGIISFFHQFGAAAGSLVPGILFSIHSSYASTLWVSLALILISILLTMMINENSKIAAKQVSIGRNLVQ